MCGLIGVMYPRPGTDAGKVVIRQYKRQRLRGSEGFGYVAISGDRVVNVQRFTKEEQFTEALARQNADTIFAHHRMPTSTENVVACAHPIFVSHESLEFDYYIMHNGVISNHASVRDLYHKDFKYTTLHSVFNVLEFHNFGNETVVEISNKVSPSEKYNDSETLAIEIALAREGLIQNVRCSGASAVIGVCVEKGGDRVVDLFWGCNSGRSLLYGARKGTTIISSEGGEAKKPKQVPINKIGIISMSQNKQYDVDFSFGHYSLEVKPRTPTPYGNYTKQPDSVSQISYGLRVYYYEKDIPGNVRAKYRHHTFSNYWIPVPPGLTKGVDWFDTYEDARDSCGDTALFEYNSKYRCHIRLSSKGKLTDAELETKYEPETKDAKQPPIYLPNGQEKEPETEILDAVCDITEHLETKQTVMQNLRTLARRYNHCMNVDSSVGNPDDYVNDALNYEEKMEKCIRVWLPQQYMHHTDIDDIISKIIENILEEEEYFEKYNVGTGDVMDWSSDVK